MMQVIGGRWQAKGRGKCTRPPFITLNRPPSTLLLEWHENVKRGF